MSSKLFALGQHPVPLRDVVRLEGWKDSGHTVSLILGPGWDDMCKSRLGISTDELLECCRREGIRTVYLS
jgi:hypothetical protein